MLTLIKYTGSADCVAVPEKFTRIGKGAFTGQSKIKKVMIPDTVCIIDEGAFDGCPKIAVTFGKTEFNAKNINKLYSPFDPQLIVKGGSAAVDPKYDSAEENFESEDDGFEIDDGGVLLGYNSAEPFVDIPNGVVEIAKNAFAGSQIQSVNISNSVKTIGEGAFGRCFGLTSVNIPFSVVNIGDFAFSGCQNLEKAAIANERAGIGLGVFDGCKNTLMITFKGKTGDLRKFEYETVLGGGTLVAYRGSQADVNLLHIIEIFPHKNINDQYIGAFEGNTLLKTIALDESLIRIGDRTFKDCVNLTSIFVPSKTIGIGAAAFFNCRKLNSITISSGLSYIGDYAFSGCQTLTYIEIPNSVETIGYNAFKGCNYIKVRYKGKDYTGAEIESIYEKPTPIDARSPLAGIDL